MIRDNGPGGHDRQWRFLINALTSERVSPAYLFFGPEGIGKKALALQFAKALNCLKPDEFPCNRCLSCKKVNSGNHPDVSLIAAEGQEIKIEQIRDLQRDVRFRPLEGEYKIYIIDDAHQLNEWAANCFLKTLEEPPSFAILILVSAHPYLLPPTILSRCQGLRFSPLSQDVVVHLLVEKGLPDAEARVLASLSEGSVGRALQLKEQAAMEERQKVLSSVMGQGPLSPEDLFSLSSQWAKGTEESYYYVLKLFLSWFRDLLGLKEGLADNRLINQDHLGKLKEWANRYDREKLLSTLEEISRVELALKARVNRQLALEVLLMRIATR